MAFFHYTHFKTISHLSHRKRLKLHTSGDVVQGKNGAYSAGPNTYLAPVPKLTTRLAFMPPIRAITTLEDCVFTVSAETTLNNT